MSGVITLKLTSLLIRTISKPVSNLIKSQTRQNEFFKRNFIKFGQFLNKIDLRIRNNNSNIKIRPLNDNKAIEMGSNFLSELFVFSIAAGLILYESFKPKKSEPAPRIVVETDKFEVLGKEIESLKYQNSVILAEINKLRLIPLEFDDKSSQGHIGVESRESKGIQSEAIQTKGVQAKGVESERIQSKEPQVQIQSIEINTKEQSNQESSQQIESCKESSK